MKPPSTQYGTLDIDTGAFTLVGYTNLPTVDLRSLVAHPDGTTWHFQLWTRDGPGVANFSAEAGRETGIPRR